MPSLEGRALTVVADAVTGPKPWTCYRDKGTCEPSRPYPWSYQHSAVLGINTATGRNIGMRGVASLDGPVRYVFDANARRTPLQHVDSKKWEELQALYRLFPPTACKGECQDACTAPIDIRPVEIAGLGLPGQLLAAAAHAVPRTAVRLRACPLLTEEGKCSIYRQRPFICRFWGSVPWMSCSKGCLPEGGFLNDVDGLVAVMRWLMIDADGEERIHLQNMMDRLPYDVELRNAWINRVHVHSNRTDAYGPEAQHATDVALYRAIHHPTTPPRPAAKPKKTRRKRRS